MRQTRLYLAWRLLRGDSIAYRLTIRDGGIDVSDRPRAHIVNTTVIGARTGLRLRPSAEQTEELSLGSGVSGT